MLRVRKLYTLLVVFLIACGSGEIKPVPIEIGDMCSFCRMAISEKQFAAQIVTVDDSVLKFDDVGCLLRYRQNGGERPAPAAMFVTDYDSRQWIKAENAYFTRSNTVKTPMGSGILAFADATKAGNETSRFEELEP